MGGIGGGGWDGRGVGGWDGRGVGRWDGSGWVEEEEEDKHPYRHFRVAVAT